MPVLFLLTETEMSKNWNVKVSWKSTINILSSRDQWSGSQILDISFNFQESKYLDEVLYAILEVSIL